MTFHKTLRHLEGFWQAGFTLVSGKRLRKPFSILLHGDNAAFALAVQARQAMPKQVCDAPYLYSQVALKAAKSQVEFTTTN